MLRPVLVALALIPSAAAADPYVLLIHETPAQIALRTDAGAAGQAYWGAYAAWGEAAAAAGVVRGGAAMLPTPVASVGTLAPGALVLGGFFQIDVATVAEAEAWAMKLPAATTGGAVEIRAAVQAPGM